MKFTGFIKNGRNGAAVDFPSREPLDDILYCIGIAEGAAEVRLDGPYTVELDSGADKYADALIHLLKGEDSLYTVNELAEAAYDSDYRACLMLEEKLNKGAYHTAEQFIKDAGKYKEQISRTSGKRKGGDIYEERYC